MKKILLVLGIFGLCACTGTNYDNREYVPQPTPTVDYIEGLDVYSAQHKDGFLNQLAMNYRSYAIYNARTLGDHQMGELFAQKAIAAFSGETPFPEFVDNWPINDHNARFELESGGQTLADALRNDAAEVCPEFTAEAQAKFDCWLSSTASGQLATARECHDRFGRAMIALRDVGSGRCNSNMILSGNSSTKPDCKKCGPGGAKSTTAIYYPETSGLNSVAAANRTREGLVIVNNVNISEHLINPVPVSPMVFNQNIFSGSDGISVTSDESSEQSEPTEEIRPLGEEYVSRAEFINMMMALREELAAVNRRLDNMPAGEKAVIKVQQVPLEPKQRIMEEVFEVRFDFNKYNIKPEYESVIRQLVETTKANKNVRISVVGHTDTVGTPNYNFALGGRRAETVRKRLIDAGIPASQIVAVSSGMNDPKVPTGPGVKNAENRRAQVVQEIHSVEPVTEMPQPLQVTINNSVVNTDEDITYELDNWLEIRD
ncbi:MAG: OmpA family protein [Alphaproteobacteria bacterium]|nr:OmpA family protein [Alphaproteobacteria bacterium]